MKNIAQAITAVMAEVKNIEKNMTVGNQYQSYKGVADKDVKHVIGQAMQKNGLCIVPIDIKDDVRIDRWEENGKQKQSVHVSVKTKYLLIHTSGESLELAGYGQGVDPQDKAAGKATTYALKYALLYAFMVPTGDIDDADVSHSQSIPTPPPATVAPARPASDVAPLAAIKSAKTLPELASVWKSLTQAEQKLPTVTAAKDARKTELTPQP